MLLVEDELSRKILKIIDSSEQPLETNEIVKRVGSITRSKAGHRLAYLALKDKINYKVVGAKRGIYIWWSKSPLR